MGARSHPSWLERIRPVDMDGAALALGISRRTLVDVIKLHPHYETRGNRKVFYPENIEALYALLRDRGHSPQRDLEPQYITAKMRVVRETRHTRQDGFIYFAAAGALVKIGFAQNPHARIGTLSTGSSVPLELLAVIEGSRKKEKDLHRRFRAYRKHGEWFRLEGKLASYVAGLSS